MQKLSIGILGILVLFLALVNVRLSSRAQSLEERLAAAEKRPVPAPLPLAAPARPEEPSAPPAVARAPAGNVPEPAPRSPTPPPTPPPPDPAPVHLDALRIQAGQTLKVLTMSLDGTTHEGAFTFSLPTGEPEPEPLAGRRAGFLGIQGEDVVGGGVKINGVIPDSVAAWSGLRPGDIVLEYNGERVETLAALTSQIRGAGEGSPASLRLRRDGVEFYQGVQLGARK